MAEGPTPGPGAEIRYIVRHTYIEEAAEDDEDQQPDCLARASRAPEAGRYLEEKHYEEPRWTDWGPTPEHSPQHSPRDGAVPAPPRAPPELRAAPASAAPPPPQHEAFAQLTALAAAQKSDADAQPQGIERFYSRNSGYTRVTWSVEAKILQSSNRTKVSPGEFFVDFGPRYERVPFKLMLTPTSTSFKKASGVGKIQLKCEKVFPEGAKAQAQFRFRIGRRTHGQKLSNGNHEVDEWQVYKGPAMHNFADTAIGCVSGNDEWDFKSAVAFGNFLVGLEVKPRL